MNSDNSKGRKASETESINKDAAEEGKASRLPIWFGCSLVVLVIFFAALSLFMWSHTKELDHDEFQHAHAGWLVSQGDVPYVDFWEHHPPFYWYFVASYFKSHGDNMGVFAWGRNWMIVTFALSCFVLWLLGLELMGPVAGVAAASMFAVNRLMHYPAMMMRPDGWMLFFLLLGVYVFVWSWRRRFSWYFSLLAGLLLGAAFALHPRSGFTILGLGIVVALDVFLVRGWGCLKERMLGIAVFALSSLMLVALPFFVYGIQEYYHNVYVWSSNALPEIDPWHLMWSFFTGGYLLLPLLIGAVGICFLRVGKLRSDWVWYVGLLILVIVNVVGVCVATRPFVQVFYVLGPFAALFASVSVSALTKGMSSFRQGYLSLVVVVAAMLSMSYPPYWKMPGKLSQQLDRLRQLDRLVPVNETYAGAMGFHPIFRRDGTRYWFDMGMQTFLKVDPSFRHDFAEEIMKTKPYLVQEGIFKKADAMPGGRGALVQYVNTHYSKIDGAPLYVRKSQQQVGK